eukprot:COSAG06_NODE_16948_length_971_cov_0.983945_1_plen_87_part_10
MRIALDEATAGDHAEVVTAIRLAGEAKVKVNQATRCVASRAACRVLTGHLYLAQEVFRREKPPIFHVQFGPNKINMHTPELWRGATK